MCWISAGSALGPFCADLAHTHGHPPHLRTHPQELSRLLNGDAKTEVQPIFAVTMVLERSNKVELQPTIQSLFDMIHKVSRNLITVIQAVPRLALQITEKQVGLCTVVSGP